MRTEVIVNGITYVMSLKKSIAVLFSRDTELLSNYVKMLTDCRHNNMNAHYTLITVHNYTSIGTLLKSAGENDVFIFDSDLTEFIGEDIPAKIQSYTNINFVFCYSTDYMSRNYIPMLLRGSNCEYMFLHTLNDEMYPCTSYVGTNVKLTYNALSFDPIYNVDTVPTPSFDEDVVRSDTMNFRRILWDVLESCKRTDCYYYITNNLPLHIESADVMSMLCDMITEHSCEYMK